MCLLSVVVPVYKTETFLRKCIDSILAQSFTDFELILVDDGSPDTCPAICDEYAGQSDRVRVIHKPNGGLVSARKAGLKAAVGQYVTYVDSDDWIADGFAAAAEIAGTYAPDVIALSAVKHKGGKQLLSQSEFQPGLYQGDSLAKVRASLPFGSRFASFSITPNVWSKWYRRELLEQWQFRVPEDITLGEDLAVSYPAIWEAESVYILDTAYYQYIFHENSMTKVKYGLDAELVKSDRILSYLTELTEDETVGQYAGKQLNLYNLYLLLVAFEKELRGKSPTEFRKQIEKVAAVMKQHRQLADAVVFPVEMKTDYLLRLCLSFWRKEAFIPAAGTVLLRKLLKKIQS